VRTASSGGLPIDQWRSLRTGPSRILAAACSVLLLASPAMGQIGGVQAFVHEDFAVDNPTSLAFSPSDRLLAIGGKDGRLTIFDIETGRRLQERRPLRSRVVGMEFSSDGSTLYVAGENKEIVQVDLLSGDILREQVTDEKILSLDVSPDGRMVLVGGEKGMVRLLTSRLVAQDDLRSPNFFNKKIVYSAFGLGGSEVYAAAEDDGRAAFWQLGEPDPVTETTLVRQRYVAFATDQDGELIAQGVRSAGLRSSGGSMRMTVEHTVRLLDWNRGRVVREIEELGDEVIAVAINPDRSIVAIATDDGTLEGYSTQEGRPLMNVYDGAKAEVIQFSTTGRWLAAGLETGRVMVWEISGASMAASTGAGGNRVVRQGDVLQSSGKYEFQTSTEPLITTFDRFTMAVLDLDNLGVDASLAGSVMNLVVSRLANVPYIDLVERGAVDQVLDELKLQNTGITSARDAAEIGRLLNAQNVLLGNVNQLGTSLTVSVRLVETESGRVLGAREILCRSCRPEDLPQGISLLVSSLVQAN
jgi:WD40 repeat protein